jgi:hypothetical protein
VQNATGQVLGVGGASENLPYTLNNTYSYIWSIGIPPETEPESGMGAMALPDDGVGEDPSEPIVYWWQQTRVYTPQSITVSLGAALWAHGGDDQFEVELVAADGEVLALTTSNAANGTVTLNLEGSAKTLNSGTVKVYRRATVGDQGRELLATSSYQRPANDGNGVWKSTSTDTHPPTYPALPAGGSESKSGPAMQFAAVNSRLVLMGQPADTSTLTLYYRVKDSGTAFQSMQVRHAGETVDSNGTTVYGYNYRADVFELDLTGWPFSSGAEYEFQYVAADTSGRLVNSGGGTFARNTSTNAVTVTNTLTAPPVRLGGGAMVTVDAQNVHRLAFFDQGRTSADGAATATNITVRYRTATGNWVTGNAGFLSGSVSNWVLPTDAGSYDYVAEFKEQWPSRQPGGGPRQCDGIRRRSRRLLPSARPCGHRTCRHTAAGHPTHPYRLSSGEFDRGDGVARQQPVDRAAPAGQSQRQRRIPVGYAHVAGGYL